MLVKFQSEILKRRDNGVLRGEEGLKLTLKL